MAPLRLHLAVLAAALASGPAGAQGGVPPLPPSMGVAEADAYVAAVFAAQRSAHVDPATHAYLALLGRLGGPVADAEAPILLRHLRQLAPVVPASDRAAWGLDDAVQSGSLGALAAGTGARLVRWWRARDDLPATPANERLAEHLARVAVARRDYADPDDPRGYDDRGEVYVRLGPPDRDVTIEVSPGMLAFDLRGRSPVGRLPANAYWLYDRVHRAAQYVFVQTARGGPYRLAGGLDLIPRSLRRASRGLRGDAEADAFLAIMEEVYGQLAVRHPAYGAAYDALSGYNGRVLSREDPGYEALRVVAQAQAADATAQAERRAAVPASVSTTRLGTEDLYASARWARFLTPDGTTRVEVVWGVAAGALRPSRRLVREMEGRGVPASDSVLLSVSAVVLTDDFEPRASAHDHRPLAEGEGTTGTLEVPLRPVPARLALQWQTRWPSPDSPRLLVGTLRPDAPLVPLRTGVLEMSDLRPALVTPDGAPVSAYPFDALPAAEPLALYFEIYGLARDTTGRTHYTVEYRVTGDRGGAETSAGVTYTGAEETAREAVEVDVSAWAGQAVEIEVRVRDEEAGAEVARSLAFGTDRR